MIEPKSVQNTEIKLRNKYPHDEIYTEINTVIYRIFL